MRLITGLALALIGLLPPGGLSQFAINTLAAAPVAPATAVLTNYTSTAIPVQTGTAPMPALTAGSWFALDATTGVPLAAHNADVQRPIASITKLATALVILHDHSLNEEVTVPTLPTYAPDDEVIGLKAGEQFTIRELMTALLVQSADDSADALALADSGTRTAFVAKMNRLMQLWGVTGAQFSNPSGLINTGNIISARAVAKIAQLALRNSTVRQLIDTQAATIHDSAGRSFNLYTTNQLLQTGQFQGIKTGYTGAAGDCFAGLTTIQGHQVITVVLGSQSRFSDTLKLTDWINQNYQWQTPH